MSRPSSLGATGRDGLLPALVEAVESLLDEGHSFVELAVAGICERAGVARSTFYLHFADKGSLLVAMVDEVKGMYLDASREWYGAPTDLSRADLEDAIGLMVGTYRAHSALLGAVVDAAAFDAAVAAAFGEMVGSIRTGLEEHLRRGRAAGDVAVEIDPVTGAGWLVWMFERGLHQLVRPASDDESDLLVETLTAFVWRAVYRR